MEWLLANLPFVWGLLIGLVTTLMSTTAFIVTARNTLSSLRTTSRSNGDKLDALASQWSIELKAVRERHDDRIGALRAHFEDEIDELRKDLGAQIAGAGALAGMARSEISDFKVQAASLYAKQEYIAAMENRLTEHFDASIGRLLQMLSLAIGQQPGPGPAPPMPTAPKDR